MAHSQYPRDLSHPCGFKTVTVFGVEEEREVNAAFAAYRLEQQEAARKAVEPQEVRRGPGRPRKEDSEYV